MNIKKIISTIAVIGCLSACMIPAVSYADEIRYEPEISMLANKGNYSIEYVKSGYELDYSTTKENYNISLKCHNSSNETRTADVYAVLYSNGLIKEIRKQSLTMLDDSSNSVVFDIDSNISNLGPADTIKVFLWDKDTVNPLCNNLTINTHMWK